MAKKKWDRKGLIDGIHPAVISVWAALIASAHLLPAIPLYGVGGTMSVSACIVPLAGVLFGPYAGALCGAIGQFVGFLLEPSGAWLGLFTFLIGTTTAFTSGMLSRGKWPIAYILNALGIIIFYCFPVGREAWIKGVTFGGFGFLCCVIGGIFAKKFFTHKNPILKAICIWTCCAGGMLTSTMLADIAGIILFARPAINMIVMAWISPCERFLFAVAATIIGLPLLYTLPKIGIHVGPMSKEEMMEENIPVDDVPEQTT